MKIIKSIAIVFIFFVAVYQSNAQKPVDILIGLAAPPIPTQEEGCGETLVLVETPPLGITYYWQTDERGESTSNSSLREIITTSAYYYLKAYSSKQGWSEATRFYVRVKDVKILKPIVSDNGRCGAGIVYLSAEGTIKDIDFIWYLGTKQLHNGATFSPNISQTTEYTVKGYIDGCSSEGVNVKAVISDPSTPTMATISLDKTRIVKDEEINVVCNSNDIVEWQCNAPATFFSSIAWLHDPNSEWSTLISSSSLLIDYPTVIGSYEYRAGIRKSGSYCTVYTGSKAMEVINPSMNLATSSLSFATGGGVKTTTLTSNLDWTISAKPSWINSISPISGPSNATVSVNCSANTALTSRSHTFTFTGKLNGVTKQTKTLTITQAAFVPTLSASLSKSTTNYVAGTFTINVASNTSWTLTDNQTWLTLSSTSGTGSKTITGTYTQNPSTSADRTATLTLNATGVTAVTKTFIQTQAPEIIVTNTNLTIGYQSGAVSTTFTPELNYTIGSKPAWVSSVDAGNGLAGTARNITFNCTENTSLSARSGSVTITGTDGSYSSTKTITINQDPTPPNLTISSNERSVNCLPGSTNINISSNTSWIISENSDWVTLSQTSGTGNEILSINYSQNWDTQNARECIISFVAAGVSTKIFSLIQAEAPNITIVSLPLSFSSEAGSETIEIMPESPINKWQLKEATPSWVSVTADDGTHVGFGVNINCVTNPSIVARNATLVFQGVMLEKGIEFVVVERSFNISQAAAPPTVLANNTTATYSSVSKTIAVSSNTTWAATESESWFTIAKTYTSGSSGNGTLTITYNKNLVASNRSGIITLQATNGNTQNITFTQQRAPILYSQEFSGLSFTAHSEVVEMRLVAELDWEITDFPEWIESISPLNGTSSGQEQQIFITCTENASMHEKTGEIIFAGTGISGYEFTQNVSVNQAGAEPLFSISESDKNLSFTPMATTKQIDVSSNISWEVIESEDWISISNATGTNNGNFIIGVAENSHGVVKSGAVTITNTAAGVLVPDITINIIQEAMPDTFYAVASGNWSNPSIWSATAGGAPINMVPNKDTKVVIDGYEVLVSQTSESGEIKLANTTGNKTQLEVSQGILTVYGIVELSGSVISDNLKINITGTGEVVCVEPQ